MLQVFESLDTRPIEAVYRLINKFDKSKLQFQWLKLFVVVHSLHWSERQCLDPGTLLSFILTLFFTISSLESLCVDLSLTRCSVLDMNIYTLIAYIGAPILTLSRPVASANNWAFDIESCSGFDLDFTRMQMLRATTIAKNVASWLPRAPSFSSKPDFA